MFEIPQKDGTVTRFPKEEGIKAFMNMMGRLGAGEDATPEHPLLTAARNSSDLRWSQGFYAVNDPDEWTAPVPDLSERADTPLLLIKSEIGGDAPV